MEQDENYGTHLQDQRYFNLNSLLLVFLRSPNKRRGADIHLLTSLLKN